MDPTSLDSEFDSAAGLDAEFDAAPSSLPTISGPGADNTPPPPARGGGYLLATGQNIAGNAGRPEFGQALRQFGEGLTFNAGSELSGAGQNAMARVANALPKGSLEWAGIDNRYPHDPEAFQRETEQAHEAQLADDREKSPALSGVARGVGSFVTGTALSPLMPGASAAGAGNLSGTMAGAHQAARAALGSAMVGGGMFGAADAAGAAQDGQRVAAAEQGGVLGAAGGMGGHYLQPIFNRAVNFLAAAPGKATEFARELAVRATGLSPNQIQMLGDEGIQELALAMERNNLTGFTVSLERMMRRAAKLRSEAGSEMGNIVDFVDGQSRDLAQRSVLSQQIRQTGNTPASNSLDDALAAQDTMRAARAEFRANNNPVKWNTQAENDYVNQALGAGATRTPTPPTTPGMSTTVQSDWGAPPPADVPQVNSAPPAPYGQRSYAEMHAAPAPSYSPAGPPNTNVREGYQSPAPATPAPDYGSVGPPNTDGMWGASTPGVLPERNLKYGFDPKAAAGEMDAAFAGAYASSPAAMASGQEFGRKEADALRALGQRTDGVERSLFGGAARPEPVTFREAQTRVGRLGALTNWEKEASIPEEAIQLARNSLAGSLETQIGQMDGRAGTEMLPQFQQAKTQFGHMADVESYAGRALAARQKARDAMDPTLLGGAQRTWHKVVGNPMNQQSSAVHLGNETVGKVATRTMAFVAETLGSNPATFGVFAKPLQEALARGGEKALGVEYQLLMDSMPGFRMMVKAREEDNK